MAILDIIKAGNKILKQKAVPVNKIDRKIKQLLDDMTQTLYHAEGVGLAAPQVGISLRVVVIDTGDGLIELVNPVIIEKNGSETASEGCLSIPGIWGEVERFAEVTVEALNREGRKIHISGKGLLARALQHEIDHLDGILFIELAKTLHKGQE